MYEYKCSNDACSETWTIREGSIGTLYLTCPFCKKGKGIYLRQIKNESELEKVKKKKVESENNADNVELTEDIDVRNESVEEQGAQQISIEGINETIPEDNIDDISKKGKKSEVEVEAQVDKVDKDNSDNSVMQNQVDITQLEKSDEPKEESIFDRIKRKQQVEKEFVKDIEEDIDVLEIYGDSTSEIEKKIKEFEDHYYIKVIDKNIVKQGNRYNCIIKYQRR